MKCGLCEGNHLTIRCPRLVDIDRIGKPVVDNQARSVEKEIREANKRLLAQPQTHPTDSAHSLTPSPNTASPNSTVSTATPNMSPNRRARYRASHLEQHRAYMRSYMRSYRARKVPG